MSAGIKKILVPIKSEEVGLDQIVSYLPKVIEKFKTNAKKIRKYYNFYQNLHNVANKVRPFDDQSGINNKVSEPHLWSMVQFKTGYAFGNPIEYAQSKSVDTDDIKYLNKYIRDAGVRSVDKNVGEWAYATGVGYAFIEPRGDIEKINISKQAPFNVFSIESDRCCKVYSAYKEQKPVFDIVYTVVENIDYKGKAVDKEIVSVYTTDFYYEFEIINKELEEIPVKTETRLRYRELPLVEKYPNESRIGIVELGLSLQDAINTITSGNLDNLQENVNQLFVLYNTLLGEDESKKSEIWRTYKRNGLIELKDTSNEIKARLETIKNEIDYTKVSLVYEQLKQTLYDTCGVPLSSAEVSSGGDTQGARLLGNGWESAYNRLLDEINVFLKADYDLLDKMLIICYLTPNCPIDELSKSEIEIKYSPNMTDNMQVKSQSFASYIQNGVPPEIAIAWCRLSSDPISQGALIREYREEQEKKEKEREQEFQKGINESNLDDIDREVEKTHAEKPTEKS